MPGTQRSNPGDVSGEVLQSGKPRQNDDISILDDPVPSDLLVGHGRLFELRDTLVNAGRKVRRVAVEKCGT
jgi:hypothetical protein